MLIEIDEILKKKNKKNQNFQIERFEFGQDSAQSDIELVHSHKKQWPINALAEDLR